MKISVELNLTLQDYLPHGFTNPFELELKENSTYANLLTKLNIPLDFNPLMLVNEKHASFDYFFSSNDKISLFPPLGGG
jgi:sulfur carrier protein ThiS